MQLLRQGRRVREPSGHVSQLLSHLLDAPLCTATGCVRVARALMAAVVSPRSLALCACASSAHKDKNSPATSCGSFSAAATRAAAPSHQHSTQNPSACRMTYTHSNTRSTHTHTHTHMHTQHVSIHYIHYMKQHIRHLYQLCKKKQLIKTTGIMDK